MHSSAMERLLAFASRHARAMYIAAAAALVVGVVLVSRVTFDPNVLRLLPKDTPSVASFQVFLRDFGSLDHLYIVFDAAEGIGDHADFVDTYVSKLRAAPEIESVDAQLFEEGKDWSYLSDRQLYLMAPQEAADALSRFRPPRIDRELAHARELLSVPSAQLKTMVQQDPLGLFSVLRDRLARQKGFVSFDPGQEGYVSADGRSRLVIVKPRGEPFDTDFCKRLFARLAVVEHEARRDPAGAEAGAVGIQAAGGYRVALEAEALIRREGIENSVGSLLLLLLIVFAVFRTPWVMLYGTVPLAIAALVTLGVNGAVAGSLSPATSGSAGMLFGLGIDGIIVLYLRYLEERRHGRDPETAITRMAGSAWSVVLAQVTTAATFFALLLIDFPTLQDLGGLVGVGILLCCAFTLLLLPAFLIRRRQVESPRALTSAWLGGLTTDHALVIVAVGVVLTIGLGVASTRLRLDTSLQKLQAQTGGSRLEEEVADRFSLPKDVLLVVNEAPSIEPLLEDEARLTNAIGAQLPNVAVSGAGVLLPAARAQTDVARAISSSGLSPDGVRRDVQDAARRTGFRADVFDAFLQRTPALLDANARITYDGLASHGLDFVLSRFIVHRGGRFESVTYLYPQGRVDLDRLSQVIRSVNPRLTLTGLPAINRDLAQQFFPQFLKGIAIGAAAVAALIYSVLRTVRQTALAMLPTVVGFIWSAGLLALLRVELDLFSLFAAVTFIGMAVDYGIYVLYRYVVEGTGDMRDVMTRTGPAIIIACGTALVGFGTLINSSYGPLRVFGIVSVVTLTCCLIASVGFLPAFVVCLDRWSRSAR